MMNKCHKNNKKGNTNSLQIPQLEDVDYLMMMTKIKLELN